MISRQNPRSSASISTLAGRAAESPEQVVWLDCRGKTPPQLYEALHQILEQRLGSPGVLFLIPLHLEHVEGPLTSFVLGLESLLQTFPVPVVLGDPSGYATLVLTTLHRETEVRLYRPTGAAARPRRILVVNSSGSWAEVLGAVLETFGHSFTLARSGAEARRALKASEFDLVLLDLDLPRMQALGIAQLLNDRKRIAVVAVSATEEPWTRQNPSQCGFRRLLSKPPSVLDVLEELA